MQDTSVTDTTPTSIRRLESTAAVELARMVSAYDDLQTVLASCERLLTLLNSPGAVASDPMCEALWTLILLSYGRAFGAVGRDAPPLTEADVANVRGADERGDKKGGGERVRWHRVLLVLRDRHADPAVNPRENYTVGVARDADGLVNAVAVTSAPAPVLDPDAVRQAGALAFPLCGLLDERIGERQQTLLEAVRDTPKAELDTLQLIEVVAVA